MSIALHGLGVSNGIAIGRASLLPRHHLDVTERTIDVTEVAEEVSRYRRALHHAARELKAIRGQIPTSTPADITAFIDAHLLMLDDYTMAEAPIELIRSRHCSAEWALMLQRDALVRVFDEMDDPYLRTRKDDVDHVVKRIQRLLLDDDSVGHTTDQLLRNAIIIADDLTPADTLVMHHEGIAGYITEFGGPISHTAILARSLGLPALVAVHNATQLIRDGETVIIDGQRGVLIAGADERTYRYYESRQEDERNRRTTLARLRGEAAETRDSVAISLQANIEFPSDVQSVHDVAASAVGLYRTEFLYINRDSMPDEEEQFETYRGVIESLAGIPLTNRTLDLGTDKQLGGLCPIVPPSSNPALGLRAIRLCLRETDIFLPQLRAILRASAYGPVRLMVPMLSTPTELGQICQLIKQTRRELSAAGLAYDPEMPIGGMIEVPAAAISAHIFARALDFLSIGTNDLIQYTLAVDRIDDEVGYLYDPLHPAILYLLRRIIQAGQDASAPITMCGEMAGNSRFTRLLLGLGLTGFSMHPSAILEIKRIIKSTDTRQFQELVGKILDSGDPEEIHRLVDQLNEGLEL